MGGTLLYPYSVLHLPSLSALSRPTFQNPFFSLKEIADRPLVSNIRADGNRERSRRNPSLGWIPKAEGSKESSDGRSNLSSNKEEILALFKRIQSSISKGESVNSKKRSSKTAEDRNSPSPSAESILEVLHQSRTRGKGRTLGKRGDKYMAPLKDLLKKEERAEHLSTGFKSTRPPSRFTRKSPIPTLSTPREEIQSSNETIVSTPTPLVPGDQNELKDERLPATDGDNDHHSMKFEDMKLTQLKEVAKSKGIKGYSKLKKSEIVELLIRSLNDVSP